MAQAQNRLQGTAEVDVEDAGWQIQTDAIIKPGRVRAILQGPWATCREAAPDSPEALPGRLDIPRRRPDAALAQLRPLNLASSRLRQLADELDKARSCKARE